MTGKIAVISGPTAVGKGTVVKALKSAHPDIWVSVSATTRPPRPLEEDGIDYCFVTDEQFDALVASDGLLEWAEVHGKHRYGTPAAPVYEAVKAGKTVILEIDLQGAQQVRARLGDATSVFLAPPSWDVLVQRLVGRGTETPEVQQRRLVTAQAELAAKDFFDCVIVNDVLQTTVNDLVECLSL